MDTLTHALSGALIARATARAGLSGSERSRRIAVGTLAAAFPDSDFVVSFISPIAYLLHHRGVTHSIILLPLWAWLIAVVSALFYRDARGWRAYWVVAALGIAVHIAGDLITSYGTMIWAPFSDVRYGIGTTFIIDLWFSGIIVAGLGLSLWRKRSRLASLLALFALLAYVGAQGWLKFQAIDIGVRHAAQQQPGAEVSVQPGPVSPFNWMVVEERSGEYRYALVNLLRRPGESAGGIGFLRQLSAEYQAPDSAPWRAASLYGSGPDAALAREAWSRPEMEFFRWFARYPALARVERSPEATCAWFYDLRFYRPGSAYLPFRYGMCRDARGGWRGYQLVGEDLRKPVD